MKLLKNLQLLDQGKQAFPTKLVTIDSLTCLVQEIITEVVTSVGALPGCASCPWYF